jgi:hypothetical protein
LAEAPGVTGRAACSGRFPGEVPDSDCPGVGMTSSSRVEILGLRRRPRLGRTSLKVSSMPRVLLPLPASRPEPAGSERLVACDFCGRRGQNTHPRCVVKLRLLSSCFEYLDFFVGNRDVCASKSCFSRKVMSEVSVSRRRGSPSARSALPLTCTPSFSGSTFRSSQKAQKIFWQKRSFFEENFNAEGVPPLLAPEGGSGCAEARPTLP